MKEKLFELWTDEAQDWTLFRPCWPVLLGCGGGARVGDMGTMIEILKFIQTFQPSHDQTASHGCGVMSTLLSIFFSDCLMAPLRDTGLLG